MSSHLTYKSFISHVSALHDFVFFAMLSMTLSVVICIICFTVRPTIYNITHEANVQP